MKNQTNRMPPEALLKDELIGTFGQREQELAIQIIVRKAFETKDWYLLLTEKDFEDPPTYYARDGFQNLIENGWLVEHSPGFFVIAKDVILRLKRMRPKAFE